MWINKEIVTQLGKYEYTVLLMSLTTPTNSRVSTLVFHKICLTSLIHFIHTKWFPHGLKNLEIWENFYQSGKIFLISDQTDWNSQGILSKILEKKRILASCLFYFSVEIKHWKMGNKNTGKIIEKSGEFFSLKMWEPWICKQ